MNILWVEDKGDVTKEDIFTKKIFNSFWTKKEIENLTNLEKMQEDFYMEELKKYSSPLFLAANLEEAWDIIKDNEPFDKIILDIEFPSEEFDFNNNYIKSEFSGNDFDNFIEFIDKDQYMGFTLAHLIIFYYSKKFNWTVEDIKNNIVFFSANTLNFDTFTKKNIREVRKEEFSYHPNIKEIRQFTKNKETDFLKWLKEDKYTIILDRYLNQSAVNEFIKIMEEKDNIAYLRPLFDNMLITIAENNNIMNYKPIWWEFTNKTLKENKKEKCFMYKFSNIKLKNNKDKINIKHFIRFLSDLKERYSIPEIENAINAIKIRDIDDKTNNTEKDKIEKDIEKKKNQEIVFEKLKEIKMEQDYFVNDNLFVTVIIQHSLYSITEITNKYQNHKDLNNNLNKETVQMLHFQLKEIILWFGKVMEELES